MLCIGNASKLTGKRSIIQQEVRKGWEQAVCRTVNPSAKEAPGKWSSGSQEQRNLWSVGVTAAEGPSSCLSCHHAPSCSMICMTPNGCRLLPVVPFSGSFSFCCGTIKCFWLRCCMFSSVGNRSLKCFSYSHECTQLGWATSCLSRPFP